MKKKMAILAAGICVAALTLTGCASEISNDYITISQYKGVEVEKVEAEETTDESVENRILGILQEQAVTTEVTDRAAEEGDTADIDYVGMKDGVAFEGGTASGYLLTLGTNTFIDGFEEGIVGHNIGDTFDLDLTFPEDYQSEELAGQAVTFTVTLNALTRTEVPELTDEFVQSVSEKSGTVEEYKEEIKNELEQENKQSAELEMKENIWNTVMENTAVTKYPKDELKAISEQYRQQYELMAAQYNMEFDEFLASANMDEDSFTSQLSKLSKNQLKQDLAVELIIEKAKIDASDETVEEVCEQIAADYGYESADELRELLEENGGGGELEKMAKKNIVLDWLFENSKQVEKTEDDSTTDSESSGQ